MSVIAENAPRDLDHGSRARIREQYSTSGREYDDARLRQRRGRLLSDHDVELFGRMVASLPREAEVLEVGAGTGRFTMPMFERGNSLIATDVNNTMLDELREKVVQAGRQNQCEIRYEDVFQLSFADARFDFVYCIHVVPRLLNLDDQRAALAELSRVVRPGGRLLFNFRSRRSIYRRIYKGHAATSAQMEQILREKGMRVVERRGKALLSRRLLNVIPLWLGRMISRAERRLERPCASVAWDAFWMVEKATEE